jgi:hypothetical protein
LLEFVGVAGLLVKETVMLVAQMLVAAFLYVWEAHPFPFHSCPSPVSCTVGAGAGVVALAVAQPLRSSGQVALLVLMPLFSLMKRNPPIQRSLPFEAIAVFGRFNARCCFNNFTR